MRFKETAMEVVFAIIPVTILITVLQFTLVRIPGELYLRFLFGTLFIIAGLILFLIGVRLGFLPLGEMIGSAVVKKGKLWLILLVGFLISFVVTVAEPDLQVLSFQVDMVSGGAISRAFLLVTVGLGVGIFVALALLRMLLRIPIVYMLIGGYALVFILAAIAPPDYLAVSFDAGGVTTGPMAVPFILSFGVGVSAVLGRKSSSGDSFGLVALASIGPILAVLLLGVFAK
ncbi:MAG: DUF1538 domain-containing protein [Clostridia bacterium]